MPKTLDDIAGLISVTRTEADLSIANRLFGLLQATAEMAATAARPRTVDAPMRAVLAKMVRDLEEMTGELSEAVDEYGTRRHSIASIRSEIVAAAREGVAA